jgi:hypothetical protein
MKMRLPLGDCRILWMIGRAIVKANAFVQLAKGTNHEGVN